MSTISEEFSLFQFAYLLAFNHFIFFLIQFFGFSFQMIYWLLFILRCTIIFLMCSVFQCSGNCKYGVDLAKQLISSLYNVLDSCGSVRISFSRRTPWKVGYLAVFFGYLAVLLQYRWVSLTLKLSPGRSLILYVKNLLDIRRCIFGMVKVYPEDQH